MIFSEDSRVKIPCILHLVRLCYSYLSLKNAAWDEEANIFPDLFRSAIARINPGIDGADIDRLTSDKYPKSFYYFELLAYLAHFKMMAEKRKMGYPAKYGDCDEYKI